MTEEKVLSSKYVYRGRAVNVRVDTVMMPDGRETTRDVVEHRECIAVVAIDPDGKVLMVDQYRHPPVKTLLEIVAGGIDDNENPEDAVRREMQEETGYLPEKVIKLGGFYSTPGYCTEFLHLYLAEDLVPGRLYAEDTENITLVRIAEDDIYMLIRTGVICDAKSIAGLLLWLDYRKSH